ncbi:MAG TPA: hypothetical protein VJT11_12680 [Nitrospiraceae bacterium]|nr:hypothetical protein [Nitrospiraceae bacterium]
MQEIRDQKFDVRGLGLENLELRPAKRRCAGMVLPQFAAASSASPLGDRPTLRFHAAFHTGAGGMVRAAQPY